MADSNRSADADKNRSEKRQKPKKPHPDFPLFPHASGRWAKKVNGRFHYFGTWEDGHQAALNRWLEQKDDLLAGRKPRSTNINGVSVGDACNHYLASIDDKVRRGERSQRWLEDLTQTLTTFLQVVGRHWDIETLTHDDFAKVAARFRLKAKVKRTRKTEKAKASQTVSPITVKNRIHRVKGMFKWLAKSGLVESIPTYGAAFDPPDKTVIDRHTDAKADRYFNRREVRALLRHSKEDYPQLFVAILLAINVGCQNEDIATLEVRHLDLRGGWYKQPRSKKAKQRRAKLWPRTVKAIKNHLIDRKRGIGSELVFTSSHGQKWDGRNCLSKDFAKLKKDAGITTPRAGFQWLRHSFITEASQNGDLLAVQIACGHASRTITENYIHKVYDPRLEAIAATVEHWLIGSQKKER